jgi:hypothetical protein
MAPAVVVPSDNQSDVLEPLVVSSSTDINGSVSTATIVQKNCCLHVRGNLVGSLTIEPGANVVIDGFVDGKSLIKEAVSSLTTKDSRRVLLWTGRRKAKLAPS